ncbi:MAG: hypothetical protein ABI983_06330 [Acidobacteriota bacterium]
MPTNHLSDIEIERFCRRSLLADELVAFTDHLGDCADCRSRAVAAGDARTAMASIETAVGRVDHVPDDKLRAFVDGGPDPDWRREISSHLAPCSQCADELQDLQAFALEMQSRQYRSPWLYSTLAAAARLHQGLRVRNMHLTADEKADLVAFLQAL